MSIGVYKEQNTKNEANRMDSPHFAEADKFLSADPEE
ncbi:hypothetical protein HNQ56_002749 [Anaerotaenia torta]